MFNNQEIVGSLPALLRAIANELERDTTLRERILTSLKDEEKNPVKGVKAPSDFDPFKLLRLGNEASLREHLEALDLPALKAIITQHGLDTTRLAQKWRDKNRLVNFIIERLNARAEKGDVFRGTWPEAFNQ